jgi:hypothetical protein
MDKMGLVCPDGSGQRGLAIPWHSDHGAPWFWVACLSELRIFSARKVPFSCVPFLPLETESGVKSTAGIRSHGRQDMAALIMSALFCVEQAELVVDFDHQRHEELQCREVGMEVLGFAG